ncbi:MAG: hypothetical protein K9K82_06730 [Desulfobacteraceae bacterium]|nr:hypothetical protein [Desulfobacteraceae bacterium]
MTPLKWKRAIPGWKLANEAHRNTAPLAVARKLVAYIIAVDRDGQKFEYRNTKKAA